MNAAEQHGTGPAGAGRERPDARDDRPSAAHPDDAREARAARQTQETNEHVRIVLRPIASSAPVAFYAFGVGTLLYSSLQLQWVPVAQSRSIATLLLAFVAPLELLAGLIAYAARDAGMATAMTIFGAVWLGLGLELLHSPPGSRAATIGIFLLAIAALMVGVGTGAARARPLLAVLALMATARFALSGVYELTGGTGVERASGWLGMPIVAVSLYGGTAFLLEEAMRRRVLPVGRRHGAAAALEGDLDAQIEPISREAGVRHLL